MIPLIDLGAQQARIRNKIDAGISRVLDHGMYIMGQKYRPSRTVLPAPGLNIASAVHQEQMR